MGSGRYLKTLEHDSLVIDVEKNIFYWNSRGIVGTAFDWLTKIEGLNPREATKRLGEFNPIFFSVPEKDRPNIVVNEGLVDIFYEYGQNHKEYWLNDRGYTNSTIDLFRLGYTGDWYTIPIYVNGQFRNFHCRTPGPDKKVKSWYETGVLPFNLDYVALQDLCIITEGPPDAIMLMQNGIPAMSTTAGPGWFDNTWLHRIYGKEIYVVFDNDNAGKYESRRRCIDVFGMSAKIYTFEDFPDKYDVTDFFKSGKTKDDFLKLIREKSKYYYEVDDGKNGSDFDSKRGQQRGPVSRHFGAIRSPWKSSHRRNYR